MSWTQSDRLTRARRRSGAPRNVVVLGASSGIGLATALRLARSGDRLVLAARDASSLARAADECRRAGAAGVDFLATDVRERAEVDAVLALAGRAGPVDAVVLSAMTMAYGELTELPSEVFSAVVDTAIGATMNVARAVLPGFRERGAGTLVVVNSLLGSVTVPRMGAYAAGKWAQRALVRTLQQELRGQRGVHVCLVSPGSVDTPIYEQAANYLGRAVRPPFPVADPDRVASAIEDVLQRPRRSVSVRVGVTNPVIIAGYRLLPAVYDALVAPLFRLASVTRTSLAPTTGNVLHARPDRDRLHGRTG